MSVKERLIEYLERKHISQKKFAESVGLSSGYVNAIRNSIQPATLNRISMQYSDLNTGWLMTGEGDMIKQSIATVNESQAMYNAQLICEKCIIKDAEIEVLKENIKKLEKDKDRFWSIIERNFVTKK